MITDSIGCELPGSADAEEEWHLYCYKVLVAAGADRAAVQKLDRTRRIPHKVIQQQVEEEHNYSQVVAEEVVDMVQAARHTIHRIHSFAEQQELADSTEVAGRDAGLGKVLAVLEIHSCYARKAGRTSSDHILRS